MPGSPTPCSNFKAKAPQGRCSHYPHFTDEATAAQRGQARRHTASRGQSQDLNVSLSDTRVLKLRSDQPPRGTPRRRDEIGHPPCCPPAWPPWPSPTQKARDHWIRPPHRAGCPHSRREGPGGSGSRPANTSPAGRHLLLRPAVRFSKAPARVTGRAWKYTPHPVAIHRVKDFYNFPIGMPCP